MAVLEDFQSCLQVRNKMGNACCGAEPAIAVQPGLTRPGLPQCTIEKVFEFVDIAQTADPLRELEATIASLQVEIGTLEDVLAQAMTAAEADLGAMKRELESLKAFVPLADPLHPVDYTSEQISYCKDRIEDLEMWRHQMDDQNANLGDAFDKARESAEAELSPEFQILKGMVAGFQKRMLKWKARKLPSPETMTHIALLEQKFNGMLGVVGGIERRIQMLKDANTGSTLADQSKAFLEAVLHYQSVSDRVVTEVMEEEIVMETAQFDGVEEKEVASAVLEGNSDPNPRPVSRDIDTPLSLHRSITFDNSPGKAGFAFPPLIMEAEWEEGRLEVSGLYNELQELITTQEHSLLRRICLENSQMECQAKDKDEVTKVFLDIMLKKWENDKEQRGMDAMPLSMDVFVVKFFQKESTEETLKALLGFLKGVLALQAANKPGSQLICKVLNVFTAKPYPLSVAQLLPGFMQSLSTPADQIPVLLVMDKLYAALNPAEALAVLRICRPESLSEGEFLVLLCCHRIQALKRESLFRLIAGDSGSIASEAVSTGIATHLELLLSPSEQAALLAAVNPAQAKSIPRMIFNKAFNPKQLLDSSRQATLTLSPMLYAENMLEHCVSSRRAVLQSLAEQFESAGRDMQAVVQGEESEVLGEVEGKSFAAAVSVLEARLVGPFRKAYLGPASQLGLSEATELPEYVQELVSTSF